MAQWFRAQMGLQVPPSDERVTPVDAVAGQTYWIAVGSPAPEPNWQPFTVHVDANPPG